MEMIKIAVIADIHGNYVALTRCMEYCKEQGITTYVFLGDYTGELAYPERTMQMLREIQKKDTCYFVRGNKEDYWADYRTSGEQGWKKYDSTTGSLYYTYHQLSKESHDFFDSLPKVQKLTFEGLPPLTICHGSPEKTNEKMLPDHERTKQLMHGCDTDVILCGHTHIQRTIEYNEKVVYNPGALGVSLYANGKSQFMILTGEQGKWSAEYVSLSYDIEKVIHDLHEAGLNKYAPGWCAVTEDLLRHGDVAHGHVLNKAMELCKDVEGVCIWPYVDEKYWQQAVEEML